MTPNPSTREVALKLDVHGQRLRQFAEVTPNATPALILGWANAEPTPERKELVADWLDWVEGVDYKKGRRRTTARGEKA